MTRQEPGDWVTRAHALRLAEELGVLRIAAANATNLPLATPSEELAQALNELAEQEHR